MLLHEQTLNINLTNSNDGQGRSWHRPAKQRNDLRRYFKDNGLERIPFDQRVAIHIVRIIGPKQRAFDPDSILRGSMCKALIDTMVEFGWFHDDKLMHVSQVVGSQEVDRDNGPAVRVEIYDEPASFKR